MTYALHPRPQVVFPQIESTRLKSNPLNDPHLRSLPVYLPPGYDSKRVTPYPSVYILSGWSGNGESSIAATNVFSDSLPELFDQAILKNEMPPFVAIFPNLECKYGHSQYVNSSATGPYMDHLCEEIVPFIHQHFHVLDDANGRGILGHSSGGFGALILGMHRPDIFRNICSSAGDSWYAYLYPQLIPHAIATLEKHGSFSQFIDTFLQLPNPMKQAKRSEGETLMLLNICACYLPNAKAELGFDLFFDPYSGQLLPELWERLLAWDPIEMVDRFVDRLKVLNWIHLQAGLEDEYGLHLGHRQLAKKLQQHDIDYVLEEYPGKHGGHYWRYVERIKRMLDVMPPLS